ncbi:MAG TPA: HAD family hydrolase, partial [Solirubrobacteraceae bacterium]
MALTDTPSRRRARAQGADLLIALDLDGTLIDARDRQVGVASEVLADLTGLELNQMRFWRAKRGGATTRQALEQLGHPRPIAIEVAQRWRERIESDEWLRRDRALSGTPRALAGLRAAGVAVAVLTGRRSAEGARLSLRSAGLEDRIDHLFVVNPVGVVVGKARALRRCQAAVFIGDTESDGAAAQRAEVPFTAVATGQRSPSHLRAQG